jgi:hypothetical protein
MNSEKISELVVGLEELSTTVEELTTDVGGDLYRPELARIKRLLDQARESAYVLEEQDEQADIRQRQ